MMSVVQHLSTACVCLKEELEIAACNLDQEYERMRRCGLTPITAACFALLQVSAFHCYLGF